jgi:uncharacterized protein (TIGR03083 family)
MSATIAVEELTPLTGARAVVLAAAEYRRVADQLRSLTPSDWTRATDCPEWDVRAMAGHTVGMMSDFTSVRSVLRRMRRASKAARASGQPMVDAMTAGQVAEHADLSTADLVARVEEVGPRAAHWRTHAPALLRKLPVKQTVGGRAETWRMTYLLDTVLTRDPWMHRVDVARATGHELVLTAGHDGTLVADVVAEWARRHGEPFVLTLTGPAGGEYVAGGGRGDGITLDAIEFCRTVSGRATGHGLLTQEVPF